MNAFLVVVRAVVVGVPAGRERGREGGVGVGMSAIEKMATQTEAHM